MSAMGGRRFNYRVILYNDLNCYHEIIVPHGADSFTFRYDPTISCSDKSCANLRHLRGKKNEMPILNLEINILRPDNFRCETCLAILKIINT